VGVSAAAASATLLQDRARALACLSDPLTTREREICRLLRGTEQPSIAAELVLSERTVEIALTSRERRSGRVVLPVDPYRDADELFAALGHDVVWRDVADRPGSAEAYAETLSSRSDRDDLLPRG
jgi:hypothetical protein